MFLLGGIIALSAPWMIVDHTAGMWPGTIDRNREADSIKQSMLGWHCIKGALPQTQHSNHLETSNHPSHGTTPLFVAMFQGLGMFFFWNA